VEVGGATTPQRLKIANRTVRTGFRVGDELTRPFRDARRFPSDTFVARTEGYTYGANVWDSSIMFEGHFRSPRAKP
jgi:hypothetical protein